MANITWPQATCWIRNTENRPTLLQSCPEQKRGHRPAAAGEEGQAHNHRPGSIATQPQSPFFGDYVVIGWTRHQAALALTHTIRHFDLFSFSDYVVITVRVDQAPHQLLHTPGTILKYFQTLNTWWLGWTTWPGTSAYTQQSPFLTISFHGPRGSNF